MNEQLSSALLLLLWPLVIFVGYKVSVWSLTRYTSQEDKG